MLGLGDYESSSEDEVNDKTSPPTERAPQEQPREGLQTTESPVNREAHSGQQGLPEKNPNSEPRGPILGPSHEDTQSTISASLNGQTSPFPPPRALIHDLTLPPVPNLEIPPSPPGTPPPAANAKFSHFLSLKSRGTHFNEKLAASSSLRNPSLLKKLMEHAGIDDQAQYSTSLPPDLWCISDLPGWGFKEELLKAQKKTQDTAEKKQAAGQKGTVDFVVATATE
ncbi:hypothetical protein P168DRAFT_290131 [Aspergillus campestris IBT 28561]|uniref:HCNGP-domain-containing protein n=1 Tax=Aspergillus campestris (strain IBT 28561) TaxID=1392248 RepID=A0A2I1D2B0_ASPC2|nr:uncharacterized protein P168DRAFT_290131 [Aspergillus campestris IBT 28561]PKY04006.1 hypothetical protein P168DRAFT_290131 [Aspergillus campestris IBT 28561]